MPRSIRLASLASVLLAFASPAFAWPTDPAHGVAIARGPGEQVLNSMTSDGAGGTLVAFADSSNQFTGYDIRVTRLRANGTLDPAWPAGGLVVCMVTGEQRYPLIVADGGGGAIVTWSDRRSGTHWDIYAHHVLATGAVDFGWPANGAIVCGMPGDQVAFEPTLVSDGAGGAIAAWNDFRDNDWDIYAHHITPIGMDAAWGAQGRPVCTTPGIQGVTGLASDGAGGVIVAWNDSRTPATSQDVYAMRVLANGTLAPGWTLDGVAVSTAALNQRYPVCVPDGQNGAIVVWQDGRNGVDTDIYGHRVLASGGLEPAIPANGAAICVESGTQARPKLVRSGAAAIVTWHDQRDGVNSAVYVHRMTTLGPDPTWPANGLAVRIETGELFQGVVTYRGLAPDGAGGAIAAWQDLRNGNWDIYAMRVLASGTLDPAWPATGRAVCTALGSQGGAAAIEGPGGHTVIAWLDGRNNEGYDSYAQRITPGGELGVEMVASGVAIPNLQRGSMDWGDYDGDGDLDLLMTGTDLASPRCYLLRNDGGTFTQVAAGLPGIEWSSAEWGDYDADGDLDIAMAGWNGTPGIARIYRNDGPFGFTDIGAGLPGVHYASVAWGDADRDGDLDLLLAGLDNSNVRIARVYRNDGGTFTDAAVGLTGVAASDADWGDCDGDGDQDLLLTGSTATGQLTRIYLQHGGQFSALDPVLPDVDGMDGSAAWGDYDADGDLDLLLSGHDGTTRHLLVFQNLGSMQFVDVGAGLTGLSSASVAWGDYDNDGDLDVLAAGYWDGGGGLSRVYRNDSGNFVDAKAGLGNVFYSSVAWADWDGDGDLDVTFSGAPSFFSAYSALHRTEYASPNTRPTAPTNLQAVRYGSFVEFSWSAANDAETQAPGLSYNLRIGTPEAPDFPVTSMSLANGFRKVVRPGNVGHRVTFGLQVWEQPLVWSVQAVDGAFAGSPFSSSATLVGVDDGPHIAVEGLHAPSPNPFRAGAQLTWMLPRSGPVELTLHDAAGRHVRTVASGVHAAGLGRATWDGRDDRGRSSPPGLYLVRLAAGSKRWSAKLVLSR